MCLIACVTAANLHVWSLQAQRHSEAARLLIDTAEQLAGRQAPPLQVKKLYVLAALEVQAFRKQAVPPAAAGTDTAKAACSADNSVLTGGKQSNGAASTLAGEGGSLPALQTNSVSLPALCALHGSAAAAHTHGYVCCLMLSAQG